MLVMSVTVPTKQISDWDTFHDTFAATFGFPAFYARNMSAWMDCLMSLDDRGSEMSRVHAPEGGCIALLLDDIDDFAARCPEQYRAIVDFSALVNWRRITRGDPPVIALAFHREG
jgi:RNAse (barnase) inhibitor barstar